MKNIQINDDNILGIDNSHTIEIQYQQRANAKAYESFLKLQDLAKKEGFSLDIASAYRDFSRQRLIFKEKFIGKRKVYDLNEKLIDINQLSNIQRVRAISLFSALPGMSRHHWGCDFDIYSKSLLPKDKSLELMQWEFNEGAYFYQLELFLQKNLENFGFYRPFDGSGDIASEPWHISYRPVACIIEDHFPYQKLLELYERINEPWSLSCLEYVKEKFIN